MKAAVAGVIVAIVVFVSGCSGGDAENFEYLRVTVDGQQTLGISKKGGAIRGVVVYFHGPDADEFAVTYDNPHKKLTERLVNANFAVVSSKASGNAFGNPQSQENYRQLANMAVEHYRVENVFFLAESMGAIAALNLMAATETSRIRGLAAINPTTDLANASTSYAPVIAESFPDRPTLELTNPMAFPPEAFTDKQMRFYVSNDDAVIPAAADALAFQKRYGATAKLSLVGCDGGFGDPSCLQGDDVLRWFTTLEVRAES